MELREVLKNENISIIDEEIDWKSSIRLATRPLVEQGYVEERYPEEIIKNTLEFGPYYIIVKDVGFIHARKEQGVISDQISIMLNKTPVQFSEEDKDKTVKLFVTFAAEGSDRHIQIIQKLAEIFCDEERIKRIMNSNNKEEIFNLLI